jgi:hypothetical protein
MSSQETLQVYLCPRCLSAEAAPGLCPRCGKARLGCRPGDPNDPCRRPIMDASGTVRTRAPLWWLRASLAQPPSWLEAGRPAQR